MNVITIALAYGPTVFLPAFEHTEPTVAKMHRAFALVCPKAWGREDWREQVSAVLTKGDLEVAGMTIDDVKAAVEFMTATEATVREVVIGAGEGRGVGWVVQADGYRRGPAA